MTLPEVWHKVSVAGRKVGDEIGEFWHEIVVENGPRYRQPREWPHLWIDFWNAFFDMNYTLGHIVGLGLPVWGVYELLR